TPDSPRCSRMVLANGRAERFIPPAVINRRAARLHRQHPEGREALRPAGADADQIRAGDQPQDRQNDRAGDSADFTDARRQGGRMTQWEFITLGRSSSVPMKQRKAKMILIAYLVGFAGYEDVANDQASCANSGLSCGCERSFGKSSSLLKP